MTEPTYYFELLVRYEDNSTRKWMVKAVDAWAAMMQMGSLPRADANKNLRPMDVRIRESDVEGVI